MSRKQRKEIPLFQLNYNHPSLPLLQAQVAENNSLLPVFIHPFYEAYNDSTTPRVGKQRTLRQFRLLEAGAISPGRERLDDGATILSELGYLLRLWRFLQQNQTMVVAVGECVPYVGATIDLFRRAGYSGDIIYYPTQLGNPKPADGEGNWHQLNDQLQLLKPKIIVVGGQLSLGGGPEGEDGCVPAFIDSVSAEGGWSVEQLLISPIVYPFWRNSSMIDKR